MRLIISYFISLMKDLTIKVVESLKSGLHPSMLEEDEIKVLEEVYGKEWYKKWNYEKEDLKEIRN